MSEWRCLKWVLASVFSIPMMCSAQDAAPEPDPFAPADEQRRVFDFAKGSGASEARDLDGNASKEDKIAAFLKEREGDARKPRAKQMQRRLEELEEIIKISDEQRRELQVASKGAVEKSLDPWWEQMDNYVRQYLQQAPQDIERVLASIGNVDFSQSNEEQAAQQSIWETTIEKVLDEQQIAAYRQSVMERLDFMYNSVAGILVSDLDRQIRLSGKQREAVMILLGPVVRENLKHLERWANDGHLPVYQLPTLLGGVDSKALEKVLSEQQIEGWNERYANFKGMWETIERQKINQRKADRDRKKLKAEIPAGADQGEGEAD